MNIPIFLSSDNNYAPLIGTLIISICKNTKHFCNFFILDGGISNENKEKITKIQDSYSNYDIEFIQINNAEIFKDIIPKRNRPLSLYSRLLIPYIKHEFDKVIYLDVDLILLDDIIRLFSIDISNKSIAAVPETLNNDYLDNRRKTLNISSTHTLFNSGVLLINCKKWKIKYEINDFLKIEKKYHEKIAHNDQDILNICFENDYHELSYQYNYDFFCSFKFCSNDIIIRHFNGIKPYEFNPNTISSLVPYCDVFWEIAHESPFYEYFLSQSHTEKQTQQLLRQIQFIKFQHIKS